MHPPGHEKRLYRMGKRRACAPDETSQHPSRGMRSVAMSRPVQLLFLHPQSSTGDQRTKHPIVVGSAAAVRLLVLCTSLGAKQTAIGAVISAELLSRRLGKQRLG